ncbi:hypothetical protein CCUS01_16003 [Colletotrichum cuscutae]|uniref:Uncharacterized protein n=1 Tax=Colletotrichum cuscutae TaxID=1209917 RepID=A0AAI9VFL1_9PEZI|nr:hypothetical protein CCUS01_16003 [Colletotrichum cuscutae]
MRGHSLQSFTSCLALSELNPPPHPPPPFFLTRIPRQTNSKSALTSPPRVGSPEENSPAHRTGPTADALSGHHCYRPEWVRSKATHRRRPQTFPHMLITDS